MPDELHSFEHAALDADIKRLALEVQRHQERPEMRGASGQEVLKQSIRSMVQSTPTDTSGQASAPAIDSPLPAYAQSAPAETKLEIEYLIDMAFHHGIEKANAEAKKSSPFVLDTFHDALVDKLYPEFQKRGILK
jgi:hypothetical protein